MEINKEIQITTGPVRGSLLKVGMLQIRKPQTLDKA
jgi:hypothetical protein